MGGIGCLESVLRRCLRLRRRGERSWLKRSRDRLRGVHGPTDPAVYNAVLEGLERVGLGMKETVRKEAGSSVERTLASGFA